MNRSILAILMVLFLFFSAQESMAQNEEAITFDTTSVPNDELTNAIKKLMELTGAINIGKQMGKNAMEMSKGAMANQLPQEFFERLMKDFESEQTSKWMTNIIVRIYRQKFTLEEINTLTAFYQTPTGKKTISLLPLITQESMKEGEKVGRHLGIKIYNDLVREGKIKQ